MGSYGIDLAPVALSGLALHGLRAAWWQEASKSGRAVTSCDMVVFGDTNRVCISLPGKHHGWRPNCGWQAGAERRRTTHQSKPRHWSFNVLLERGIVGSLRVSFKSTLRSFLKPLALRSYQGL